ncbi:MAG: hypothetical protein KDD89_14500, partial [Anaerolineales bacterium]|nr:hypothetical protein [Anaerolineales bacterium]
YPLRLYPRRQKEPNFQPFLAEINTLNLPPDTYKAIMGGNAERLFNEQLAMSNEQKGQGDDNSQFTIHSSPVRSLPAKGFTIYNSSLQTLTTIYPETIPILARYGLTNWTTWEPLGQAAAAHGLGYTAVETLLAELRAIIQATDADSLTS